MSWYSLIKKTCHLSKKVLGVTDAFIVKDSLFFFKGMNKALIETGKSHLKYFERLKKEFKVSDKMLKLYTFQS